MNYHNPQHVHKPSGKKRLTIAICIIGSWFFVELIGGMYANSLALLADAAHMLTDLAALGLSLFALNISARPATHEKTYGYMRAEILAALANGVFLILISLYIFYEAYQRFLAPPEVKSIPMIAIASAGLLATVTAGPPISKVAVAVLDITVPGGVSACALTGNSINNKVNSNVFR